MLAGPTYPVANRLAKKIISRRIRLVGKTTLKESLPVRKWCGIERLVCCKVMVSINKVTSLYILVSGRKKSYRPKAFGSPGPIIKRALCILFRRVDSVFLIGCPCGASLG